MGSYNYYRMFGCFNRKFKISESEPPPAVQIAFAKYSVGGTQMTANQFLNFLVEYQGEENCTVGDAEGIMHQVIQRRHHLTKYTRRGLTLEDFFYFLFQDDLNGPIKKQVHHDMTAPLQHYFIYTGHNSYLTGNQLSSDCSEIPIIKALERGVRGIELDLWPNSAKDNIHVLHGRTLTTPIPLIKCLKSIKEHAFVNSPYPVIITLEDHLTPELQAKVAEMATQVFGEMLYYPDSGFLEELPSPESLKHRIILSTKPPKEYLESKNAKDGDVVSPAEKESSEDELLVKETSENPTESEADARDDEDGFIQNQRSCQSAAPQYKRLVAIHAGKHGIILSTKPLIENLELENTKDEDVASPVDGILSTRPLKEYLELENTKDGHIASPVDESNAMLSTRPLKEYLDLDLDVASPVEKEWSEDEFLVKEMLECTAESEAEARCNSDPDDEDGDIQNQRSCQSAAPQYKRLIAIRAGKPKRGLRHALVAGIDKINRLSLNEQDLERAASSYGTDVVRFTQKNILRVFPKGTRVTSSNFNPCTGWIHGAQMVAFNMQGYGKSLWLMHGMFRSNGGCGYVKKPELLMTRGPENEVFDPKITFPVTKTLKVTVFLGDGWRLDFSHTYFDSYSPPDFYTKVYVVGVPADNAKKKTRIIEDDWGPIWDEDFIFPLTVPELALLRIEIREYDMSEKDDFGGQTCLPVSELRPGIRAVPLYDKKGEKLKSVRLLMRFQFL